MQQVGKRRLLQDFGEKARNKETTGKSKTYVGEQY
jgi:hypothetical protein